MEDTGLLVNVLSRGLVYSTPLLWGTLGEIYAERSGVMNLGVEGMMMIGAFTSFATAHITGNPWLGVLVAAIAGGLLALIHAFLTITLRANQVVSGLALGMFGSGLANMLGRGWEGFSLRSPLTDILFVPVFSNIPLLGPIVFQNQNIVTYIGILLAIMLWLLLYKTKLGLVIRSVGESPGCADALGINIFLVRYLCVIWGGALAGIGGAFLSLVYRPAWTAGMSAGMGWIALALTIFAAWNPLNAVGGALLFGTLFCLAYTLQPWMPPEFLKIIPYASTILVLTILCLGKAREGLGAPAALGIPYKRGEE
ncbi:MAG TPA: ABC transporter permease [Candidatus Atribacteria bacterium]|uniref:Inner-membrane translocator n=1 Tax=candidate division TA06 bacterium 34_109 TaxID=1635277 RepID=A0A101I0T1_UNCT6|nr:MAG: Inner-membrane translocator [candidate division TA06 bacterium 34_109]HBY57683.1 ABC transporter permease [Candidatus Atribacteria bacterium]